MFDYNVNTGLVRMYGLIGGFEGGIDEQEFMAMLDSMGGRDITIQLKSEGGEVAAGISIYNQIKNYPGQVSVEIDSLAASIASVFPMAADTVSMHGGSLLMIHNPWTMAIGDAPELRKTADLLEKLGEEVAHLYALKTGRSAAEHVAAMASETWYSAVEAEEIGFVDRVLTVGDNERQPAQRAAAMVTSRPRLSALGAKLKKARLRNKTLASSSNHR